METKNEIWFSRSANNGLVKVHLAIQYYNVLHLFKNMYLFLKSLSYKLDLIRDILWQLILGIIHHISTPCWNVAHRILN